MPLIDDLKGDIYSEINNLIGHYNTIKNHISKFKKKGKPSSELKEALAPYTYYDALSDFVLSEERAEDETGALDDFLKLIHDEYAQLTFNWQKRFRPLNTLIVSASFVLGYLSVEFFNPLSVEGAPLLPFLNYAWLAVAGGVGLNFFLNSYFFNDSVNWSIDEALGIFKNVSPELARLQNLDSSSCAKAWRGFKTFLRLSFVSVLAGTSVGPFAAADWDELASYSNLVVVIIMYLSLHLPGSETVRQVSLKAFNPFHWAYRHCCYSKESWHKYNTELVAQKVHLAFKQNLESAFNQLLQNKVGIRQDLLQAIFELTLKHRKTESDAIKLFLLINSLALSPDETYMLNDAVRKLIQVAGVGGITLTLLGYTFDSADKASELIKEPVLSTSNVLLSSAVALAFLGLYNKIIWDTTPKIYDATAGVPVNYV